MLVLYIHCILSWILSIYFIWLYYWYI